MADVRTMLRHDGAPDLDREALHRHLDALATRRRSEPWSRRFAPATLKHRGVELHLETIWVDQPRATVVFMPGTNAYALLYGEFLAALADRGFNVVGFDPRGHGLSGGPRGSYTIAELIDDFDAVLRWTQAQSPAPTIVAGSSQGGITAFYLQARSELAIAGAVCHNIADLGHPERARLTRFPRLARVLEPLVDSAAKFLPELPVPMSLYLDLGAEPVSGLGTARDVLLGDPLTVPFVRAKTLHSLSSEPLPCELDAMVTPLLIVQAGEDKIFPTDYIEDLFRRYGGPKDMVVYPGLAHYMIVDHVPAFLNYVCAFIDRVTS